MGKMKGKYLDIQTLLEEQGYDMRKDDVRFSDAQRMLENKLGYNNQNEMYECRYEERDGDYTLKKWRDGHETLSRGLIQDIPDWLARIRDIATVGGHLKRVVVPPPDNIVWFTTDDDGNLLNFMELR
jgi:hypothetical protein